MAANVMQPTSSWSYEQLQKGEKRTLQLVEYGST